VLQCAIHQTSYDWMCGGAPSRTALPVVQRRRGAAAGQEGRPRRPGRRNGRRGAEGMADFAQQMHISNEEALERYLVTLFEDYNFKQSQRIHKGGSQCYDTLESLFD